MGQTIITTEQVFKELKKAVSSALGVEMDEVKPDSVLTVDLGAESLDFLDISYQLEQSFGFRMARHFVLEHAEELFGEGKAIDEAGRLTPAAVEMLKIRFEGSRVPLEAGMDMDEVVHLVTVESMAKSVMDILDTLPETCPQCGAASWKTADGTHILCGSCDTPAVFAPGDDLVVEWLHNIQREKSLF